MNGIPETTVYPDELYFQDDDRASRHSSHGSMEQLQFQDGDRASRHKSRRGRKYIEPKTVTVSVRLLIGSVVCIAVIVGVIAGVLGGLIAHALKKTDCDTVCSGLEGNTGSQQKSTGGPNSLETTTNGPGEQQTTTNRTTTQQTTTNRSGAQETTTNRSGGQQTTTNRSGAQQTTNNPPVAQQTTTNSPVLQQTTANRPGAQQNTTIVSGSGPPSTVYTRWGRTVCPGNTTTVYKGYAAGSHYTDTGGMSTTICLPDVPQWGNFQPGARSSFIYASEYEGASRLTDVFGEDVHQHDVPCCVCEAVGRSVQVMIPARTQCYGGWFLEYTGYLMTSANKHTKSDAKCVDSDPEMVLGGAASNNGLLFYFVEANGVIPNPPYVRGRELACSVCTK